jgi:tetratricopeptide (TPR) repeat protein
MQKQVIRLEVALGRDHPKTLDSTSHLALIYRDASKWLGAEELQLEVLERRERTLGEMHPHTLDSLSALASTFMATGRLDEAVKLHRKLIDKARYLLGEEHHITLERMKDLAYMLQSRGLYEEALDMEGQVRTAIVREFGTASPDAIESMHRTSAILHRMGRKDDAFALMSESAKLSPRDPGPDHHSLAQRGIDLTETWTRKDMKPTVESRVGRKGETLLPKTVVHRDALNELAYEYDERKDFFILQIALGKDQVDEVIRLSEDVLKLSEMYNARDNVLAPKRLDHEDTSDDDERDEYDVEMRWRRGKTRMPKRLVHRDALHDLAYRYDEEEEEDFFVLPFALNREEIDEVIKISKVYKKDERSVEIDGWTATDPDSCKNTNDEAGGSVNTIGS